MELGYSTTKKKQSPPSPQTKRESECETVKIAVRNHQDKRTVSLNVVCTGYSDKSVNYTIQNFYMPEYVVIIYFLVIKKKMYCCLYPVAVKPCLIEDSQFVGCDTVWSGR